MTLRKQATLGEVCTSIDYGVTASADFAISGGPKMLRITDIQEDGVAWDRVPGCLISFKEEQSARLTDGDIVIARTGGTVGKSFLISDPPRAVNASYLLRLRPNKNIVEPEYLSQFLGSRLYWQQLNESARGAAQPNVNSTVLATLKLPLIEINAQRRIAASLKAQLAEVETARAAVTAQLRDVQALTDAIYKELLITAQAPIVPLGTVLSGIQAGKSFLTAEYLAGESQLGVLKVSAVSWQRFRPEEAKALLDNYEPKEMHRVKRGDLLISRANTKELIGAVVLCEQDYPRRLLSDKTLRLIVDESRASKEYLITALRLPLARKHIEHFATGTSDSMRNISHPIISAIPIPLPPLPEQVRIARRMTSQLAEIEVLRSTLKQRADEISALPQRILASAFEM